MLPLFNAPIGYRFVNLDEPIKVGDIVCDDYGKPMFKIGPNHREIGQPWDEACMPMLRKET